MPGGEFKRQAVVWKLAGRLLFLSNEALLINGTAVMESGRKSENRNKEDMEHTELASLWSVRKGLLSRDSDILNLQNQETKIIKHIENGKKENQ